MSFGSEAKIIIGAIAPTLGTALGGPFGGLAGSLLSKALGTGDDKATEAAILGQSPESLAKVKQAELDLQAKLAELGVEKEQLAYADTDSARAREETVKDSTPRNLAYGITFGFFGILAYLLFNGKPPGGDVIMVMLGALGTAWTGVIGYYFGSSAGSDNKAATIAKLAGGAQANAAAAAAK
jgi:hypothetical protein